MTRKRGSDSITDVPGIRVGHAEATQGSTGVTVARFDAPAPTVVEILGGASATFDTGSLALDATFGRRWAVFFSGGSVFGLDAARGIREALLAEGEGHRVFRNPNRVVPVTGATLFDLPADASRLPDYAELGARAARAAGRGPVAQGRRGAGVRARVGKYLGRSASSPGGIGSASCRFPGGGTMGVLVVANAVGAVWDSEAHEWAAGARGPEGHLVAPDPLRGGRPARGVPATGTTLALVATDLEIERGALSRVASIASTGIGRSVIPAFTSTDGDVLFAATTARTRSRSRLSRPGELADRLGFLAADLVARAVVRAVRAATET